MVRWLVAPVFVLLLFCFGFGAVAQNLGEDRHGCSTQAQAASDSLLHDNAASDDADKSAASGEAASDHSETIGASHEAFVPALFSEPAPQRALMASPSPSIERPKRPPRAEALTA